MARVARGLGLLAAVLTGLVTVLLSSQAAYAHATVVSTSPTANTVLPTQPVEVSVTFSEPVSPVKAQTWVVAPDGARANSGDAAVRGATMTLPLRQGLPNGTYLVTYRVISADGHPVPGGFTFSIGAPSAAAPALPDAPDVDPAVELLVQVNRGLAVAGLALALGPTLLLIAAWSAPRRGVLRLTATGLSLVAVTAMTGLYLQAPYTVGSGLFGVGRGDIAEVVSSRFGIAMLLRMLTVLAALPILLFALRRDARKSDKWCLGVLGLACVASWPLAGHATTSPMPPLTVLTDTVHVGAGAIWVGGLAALVGFLVRPSRAEEAARFLPVWSAWATRLVIALAVAGVAQALIEIGQPAALFSTTYGRLVVVKAALFALVLGTAAIARAMLRKRVPDEPLDERETRGLRGVIAAELVIAAVIIAVTAVLVQTTPARVAYTEQQQETAGPVSKRLSSNYFQLQLEIDPGRVGANTMHLYAFAPDGTTEIDPLEWKITMSLPSQNLAAVPVDKILELSPNHVTADFTVPTAGDWSFSLTLRTGRTEQATVTQTITIR
ncbi:transport integral membrane protein [Actinorhabdospora filicis]|uniref:Transport integral membrane protein n=1 Tax=Actinorhabdospora filicis TaxID=1785913 RepID=A0A9W6W6X6_9ACTN|nr:copper resistance protein CopC [Actinorhabdospora filicis]GLZ82027.1 transport integral membrane protein [Actinorhabdospora filicis]